VIADEPTTALDVSIQAQIITLLKDLTRDHGTAVMLVTHDMGVIAETADRVAVMYAGRIVEIGETRQIFEAPRHPYTSALLSAAPVFDPAARARHKRVILSGEVPDPARLPGGCPFHPRCPQNDAGRCATDPPTLLSVQSASGAHAACHYADTFSLPGMLQPSRSA
jgi:oligopeptide/dipeptide ABC transporter ATP-binding protein